MTDRMNRWQVAIGVAAWLVVAVALTGDWVARAQEGQGAGGRRFTGSSTALDATGLRVSHRRFEPGARSAWHRHTHGQLLFVEEGRARVGKRGAAIRELGAGESDYTGPNVEHWHGAVPDTHFVQVAVSFGDGVDWFDLVTDDEYAGR